MSATEVLARHGTWALLRFTLGLLVFVVVHLTRLPLVWVARALEVFMQRVDGFVLAGVPSRPAPRPTSRATPGPDANPRPNWGPIDGEEGWR